MKLSTGPSKAQGKQGGPRPASGAHRIYAIDPDVITDITADVSNGEGQTKWDKKDALARAWAKRSKECIIMGRAGRAGHVPAAAILGWIDGSNI